MSPFEGTERMDPKFVRYMAGLIKRQRKFRNPDDLEKARKRLETIGRLSLQRIEEAPKVLSDGKLPLTIKETIRKRKRAACGYWGAEPCPRIDGGKGWNLIAASQSGS